MSEVDSTLINAIAQGLVRFAEATRSIEKDQILAALSGQRLLKETESLDDIVCRALITLAPEHALRDPQRKQLWVRAKDDPKFKGNAARTLKAFIEADLRHPIHGALYMFPAKVHDNQTLRAYLARNAAQISDIVGQALSADEARHRVVAILKKYAGPGRQRRSAILKIRVLKEELVLGESIPIEVYLSDGVGMRNMTSRVQITVEPSFRAEITDNVLLALAPGPIRLVVQSDSERSELDLFIKPTPNASIEDLDSRRGKVNPSFDDIETRPLERPPEDDETGVPSLEDVAHRQTLSPNPDDAPTMITSGPKKTPSAYDMPLVPSQNLDADDTPTKMLENRPHTPPPLPTPPPPVGQVIANAMDPGLVATVLEPGATTYEPAAGRGTARFFGQEAQSELANTHRASFSHLVLALVVMTPEPPSRPYDVLINGQSCLKFGSGFFQHFLLRPGGRTINIELESEGRCIVRDRLELTWTCPENPQGKDPDSPPVCIEMFWRFEEGQSQARSRVRVLATSRFVSLSDGQSGQALRMVRKPGNVYSGSLDLSDQARSISFLSRSGEHSLDLQTKRNQAQWS